MPRTTAKSSLPLPRRGAAGLLSVALLTTALSMAGPLSTSMAQTVAGGGASAAMAETAAIQAAERILDAVRRRDAIAYYNLLAPAPQRVSSMEMAHQALQRLPQLLSWRIGDVEPGLDSNSVTALVQTSAGPREVLLVVDAQGRLEGYHLNLSDAQATDVVRSFMQALSQGHYVTASSYLSDRLREEIPQPELQRKWLNLQLLTGNFQSIQRITRAESNDQMKLVIVTAKFNRLTDNLFVSLNSQNQIISVDFPEGPAAPSAAAR